MINVQGAVMFKNRQRRSKNLADQVLVIAERFMRKQGIHQKPDLDTVLSEDGLGLDSMARLALLGAIEEELRVNIPEEYWGSGMIKNLRHLVEVVS